MGEEVERLVTIIQNPRQFKVPDWMLNRKKDVKDGKFSQVVSNTLDMKLREDLERLKKIRAPRSSALLGSACAWPADEDDRPQGPHRRRQQEEGLDFYTFCCGSAVGKPVSLCYADLMSDPGHLRWANKTGFKR